MNESINGDLGVRVAVDSGALEWSASPSGTVWRKRLHLVGPPESGQVTSVVRYLPNSTFHAHVHPDGEEILVLDGVFSDEHGDWAAGTYLLNPEGFRHAPFSRNGCLLFVKLRQYPGAGRVHVVRETESMQWEPTGTHGCRIKRLYDQAGFEDSVRLEEWSPGARPGERVYARGAEMFVLEGAFADEQGSYATGTWLRFPTGAAHALRTDGGCRLYVKEGGLRYLEAAAGD
jgi:anti-sigma factor ChrR (cupin superfamily)